MDLQRIRVWLHEARRLGRVPFLDADAIKDSLRAVRTPRPSPEFLRPNEIRALLEAALRHDRETFDLTRLEKAGLAPLGATPRYEPIAGFTLFCLLTGTRFAESAGLTWDSVYLDGSAPEIVLASSDTKSRTRRSVDLAVSPSAVDLLRALRLKSAGDPYVFGGKVPFSRDVAEKARGRLVRDFAAPAFTWQRLRQTCDTILNCAPGIYGGGAAFLAAKRLGHSVVISEKHYAGLLRDLPKDAATIEAAVAIADVAGEIVRHVAGGQAEPEAGRKTVAR